GRLQTGHDRAFPDQRNDFGTQVHAGRGQSCGGNAEISARMRRWAHRGCWQYCHQNAPGRSGRAWPTRWLVQEKEALTATTEIATLHVRASLSFFLTAESACAS